MTTTLMFCMTVMLLFFTFILLRRARLEFAREAAEELRRDLLSLADARASGATRPATGRVVAGATPAIGGITAGVPASPSSAAFSATRVDPRQYSAATPKSDRNAGVVHKLRLGMMIHGVDLSSHPGGVISATHGEAELEDTVAALRQTLRMLQSEGEL